jgi:hypothetical protein
VFNESFVITVIIHIGQWRHNNESNGLFRISLPLAGKTYRVTAESGSGVFPSTGSFTVVFLSSQSWYTVKGNGVNFPDSWGMYSYSSSGASGIVKADDSIGSEVVFSFTFNTAISGTYVATSMADGNSTLSGTFTEL